MTGKTVGNYKIIEEIGNGGMGRVYKAIHLTLNRIVAVKMIHPNLVDDLAVIKRFYKEAKTQARLNHPNIVTVYDFLEIGGNYFIIMEYVHGESVGKILSEQGPFEPYIALSIFRQMLTGIGYAHLKRVIHRDIKPNNFILTPSIVKITDFGIAQIIGDPGLGPTEAVFGTPRYMSPEQILGGTIDHRTDIYSLGVTFYEMLTGRVPFNSDSDYEIKKGHLELPPPLPTQIRLDIPRELENIVLRALLKKPEERFQSVNEFIIALENIYQGKREAIQRKKKAADSLNLDNIQLIEESGLTIESLENLEQEEKFDEKGDLDTTPYPALLLSFYREKRTGVLILDSRTILEIHFLEGLIVFVEGGDPQLALGNMLVDREKITKADQKDALGFALEAGIKIGEALVKMGKITSDKLERILETQIREKLIEGFQYKTGSYKFRSTKNFTEKAVCNIHPMQVIYTGTNRFIEKGEILRLLYEQNSSIIPNPDIEEEVKNLGLSYKELELVELLRKGNTLEQAILKSPLSIDDTLRFLYSLNSIELLQIQGERLEFNDKKQVEKIRASLISGKTEVADGLKTKKLEQINIKRLFRGNNFQESLKKFFR
ncbi:MAG: serine/threonine protein kinase [Ignavibacteriales bacterium]